MEELKLLLKEKRKNLSFYKLVSEGETDERLDRAAELVKQLIGAVQNGFSETVGAINSVKADTSAMLEKQDKMLEKQDLQLEITKQGFAEVKDEMHQGFAEVKEEMAKGFGDMHHGIGEVREEVHLMRDDFHEMFMHEVSELRGEIAEVKATLARMQAAG